MGVALMNSRVSDVHLTQKAKVKVRIYSNFINRSSKSKKKPNLTARLKSGPKKPRADGQLSPSVSVELQTFNHKSSHKSHM